MNEVKFKVGDLVYCPSISTEILTIKVLPTDVMVFDITHSISRNDCGFVSYLNNGAIVRLDNGCCMKTHCQKIVYATQENYELLSKLYPNVTFEPPPKCKDPKEIIQAMLDSGWQCVPCYTGENRAVLNSKHKKEVITGLTNDLFNSWAGFNKFAIPFDPKTGEVIRDFVNGEVVLEG